MLRGGGVHVGGICRWEQRKRYNSHVPAHESIYLGFTCFANIFFLSIHFCCLGSLNWQLYMSVGLLSKPNMDKDVTESLAIVPMQRLVRVVILPYLPSDAARVMCPFLSIVSHIISYMYHCGWETILSKFSIAYLGPSLFESRWISQGHMLSKTRIISIRHLGSLRETTTILPQEYYGVERTFLCQSEWLFQ